MNGWMQILLRTEDGRQVNLIPMTSVSATRATGSETPAATTTKTSFAREAPVTYFRLLVCQGRVLFIKGILID